MTKRIQIIKEAFDSLIQQRSSLDTDEGTDNAKIDAAQKALDELEAMLVKPGHAEVTSQVDFGDADGECLPLTKCVCGEQFAAWDQILSIYPNHPWECPKCHVKLIFSNAIRVYRV